MNMRTTLKSAVVIDDPVDSALLARMLKEWQWADVECRRFASLDEAYKSPWTRTIDVLFVDERRVAEEYFEPSWFAEENVPVCFLITEEKGLSALRRALLLGARDYLCCRAMEQTDLSRYLWGVVRGKQLQEMRQPALLPL